MISNLILSIECIMYYVSGLFLLIKFFGEKYNVKILFVSGVFYILVLIVNCVIVNQILQNIIVVTLFANILWTKLCIRGKRLGSIISLYFFLFFVNALLASLLITINTKWIDKDSAIYIELIVNFFSMVCCVVISYTGIGTRVRMIIDCCSKNIKRLIIVLTMCMSCMSLLLLDLVPLYSQIFREQDIFENLIKIFFIIVIIIIVIMVSLLLVYSVSNKHIKSIADNFQKQIKVQSDYYVTISKYNFEMRRFKHDYKNMCIGVSALISEGKNNEALELLKKNNPVFESDLIKFDTGNGIVDALLVDKHNKAGEIGAVISFEGALPPDIIDPADLCIIFGNTIDNAIEACAKIDTESKKEIRLTCSCNSGFIFIDIINPVVNKVEINGDIPKTSKEDKTMHGFGLYSVKKTLKQYDGDLNVECDDKQFHVSMELCTKKNPR